MKMRLSITLCGMCLSLTISAGELRNADYDPLAVAMDFKPAELDLSPCKQTQPGGGGDQSR